MTSVNLTEWPVNHFSVYWNNMISKNHFSVKQNDQWNHSVLLSRMTSVSTEHDFSESFQHLLQQHGFSDSFQCVLSLSMTSVIHFSVYSAWLQWIISVCTQHGFSESFQCVLSMASVNHFSVYSAWLQWTISVCTQHGFSESFQCVLSMASVNHFSVYSAWLQWIISVCTQSQHGFSELHCHHKLWDRIGINEIQTEISNVGRCSCRHTNAQQLLVSHSPSLQIAHNNKNWLKSTNPFTIQWNWEFIPWRVKDLAVYPLCFGDGYVDQDIYNIV